ncbi:hypothetical protein CWS01_20055 [Niallia nealsonii]|uniref:Stress-response A/B barrel domain-containing protein n=1 Tax=Niallia nealsonii TaxID=115979 RepID=A0A2N0YXD8_9BACI|nr:Dabb family protein [Niallia nealsonii]PKG21917.1 hypothetical protein CWS01_20055 [Niallia nealsonii]
MIEPDTFKEGIPGILELTAGINVTEEKENIKGYTLGLRVTFKDKDALDQYGPHPLHQEFVGMLEGIIEDVIVVDYPLSILHTVVKHNILRTTCIYFLYQILKKTGERTLMGKEKGSKEKEIKVVKVVGDKKEMQAQMLELQRESTETLNKVLNEITLLNSNLEKMEIVISSMQQNVPTTNSSSILANLDADTMLNLLPVARSLSKGTETGQAMYPTSQVPQPSPLSFLNNLDVDKILDMLMIARSLYKSGDKNENKE